MTVEATHTGRVVELLVIVRRDYKPDAWEVRVLMLIAPGETLTHLAQAIGRRFRPGAFSTTCPPRSEAIPERSRIPAALTPRPVGLGPGDKSHLVERVARRGHW